MEKTFIDIEIEPLKTPQELTKGLTDAQKAMGVINAEGFETSWAKYLREQIPKDVAKYVGKRSKVSYRTSDWKYQWNYVMPLWEKVCTVVFLPITATIALIYFCFEIPSFIINLCRWVVYFYRNKRL